VIETEEGVRESAAEARGDLPRGVGMCDERRSEKDRADAERE
jgi:hypothetical protein